MESNLFNPLDKENLGKSIVEALVNAPVDSLEIESPFKGAGIYAVYYHGSYSGYEKLAELNREGSDVPIYVGKAIPKGGRKGITNDASLASRALYSRINDHAKSVTLAENLELTDFTCRYLIVDDIWIGLGEALLIQKYKPLWNQVVEGFGNHDPGGGRRAGKRPLWDELHPGRKWAEKCVPAKLSEGEILEAVERHFS
jgi:hypothetical protein